MKYVYVRLTAAQAAAASNATDLIADSLRADGNAREAAIYQRASAAISAAQKRLALEAMAKP